MDKQTKRKDGAMLTKMDFTKYHADNPDIYKRFRMYTFKAIKAGRTRLGSQMILERIRWHSIVEAQNDMFKINNNYAAFYARLFEAKFPVYKGFFRTRRSVADLIK